MNALVSCAWLAEHLDDPGLVVVDATLPPVGVAPSVDTRARYLAQHIPESIFFDIDELSDRATPLPHMLPAPEDFSQSMSALGIGDGMTVVVYEQEGVFSAPRAWWMLRILGVERVYLLDGGLRAWMDAGLATHSGAVDRSPASFHAKLDEGAVKDLDQVRQMIEQRAQIVDARSAARFSGAAPEPRAGIGSGHMPGATNVPFTELSINGRFKSAEALRQIFIQKGLHLDRPITTTCGSGITAAVVSVALEIAGAKAVSLYDGSWAEYAQQPHAVVEKGG